MQSGVFVRTAKVTCLIEFTLGRTGSRDMPLASGTIQAEEIAFARSVLITESQYSKMHRRWRIAFPVCARLDEYIKSNVCATSRSLSSRLSRKLWRLPCQKCWPACSSLEGDHDGPLPVPLLNRGDSLLVFGPQPSGDSFLDVACLIAFCRTTDPSPGPRRLMRAPYPLPSGGGRPTLRCSPFLTSWMAASPRERGGPLHSSQIIFSFFPTLSRISSARVNSSWVWVAVTMVRMRALPSGTVGKPRL